MVFRLGIRFLVMAMLSLSIIAWSRTTAGECYWGCAPYQDCEDVEYCFRNDDEDCLYCMLGVPR